MCIGIVARAERRAGPSAKAEEPSAAAEHSLFCSRAAREGRPQDVRSALDDRSQQRIGSRVRARARLRAASQSESLRRQPTYCP
jgi:hypothetical protein